MVAVYGATGTVGRLVADRLDRIGARATLIGPSAADLAQLAPPASFRTAVAPPADAAAIERALDGCRAVVNCAPAHVSGDLMVRAALDAGIHYIDAAVEQDHIRRIFETYDAEATHSDVVVLPAFGFHYAVGDCLARLAAKFHEPADEVVVAYSLAADVDSVAPAAAALAGSEVVYRQGQWRRVPFELDRASFEFPLPLGRRQMSRYGSGEVITVPRHTDTRNVRTLITASSLVPHPALLPMVPALRPVVGLIQRTPARHLLAFAAGALRKSLQRDDVAVNQTSPIPSAPASDARRFMIVAEAHGPRGSVGRAVATGDDAHRVTAALLARGAAWLAAGSVVAGVRSAATAFEPEAVLNALSPNEIEWRTE